MNYYVGISTDYFNKIKSFHLIDLSDLSEEILYHGIKKIKSLTHNQVSLGSYDFIIPISKGQFSDMLELGFNDISYLSIKDFVIKYSLEEYMI